MGATSVGWFAARSSNAVTSSAKVKLTLLLNGGNLEGTFKGTIADVNDVSSVAGFGKKNSGSLGSSRTIFANLGIDIDKRFELFYGGYGWQPSAIVDARMIPGTVPR